MLNSAGGYPTMTSTPTDSLKWEALSYESVTLKSGSSLGGLDKFKCIILKSGQVLRKTKVVFGFRFSVSGTVDGLLLLPERNANRTYLRLFL